jgi:hypothetical protein
MDTNTFALPSVGAVRARKLLVLIFAVAGIILGLVAMHSVDLGSSAAASASSSGHSHGAAETQHKPLGTVPGVEATVAGSGSVMAVEGCTGMCAMECFGLGMACAMALLTVALILGRRAASSWMLLPKHLAESLRALPQLVVLAPPPSLTALSISRT